MNHTRLDQLSDGIFAIVMTILVFDIKLPTYLAQLGTTSNEELWVEIETLVPAFLTYLLTFALLFTYWRAHHFFNSVYAKNIDPTLTNINGFFFMLVSLIPFSASLLGHFSTNELAISVFGVHIVLIGMCLYWMRRYVLFSPHIKNPEIPDHEIKGSTIKVLIPVIFAIIAIPLSFYSTSLSLFLFTVAVIFNLFPSSTRVFERLTK
ncbi:MAG: TMEM175 family protein [Candidatus Nomurabacteria bacterium]|nr:TMEM175 family protein [Candidatus Nomurabacteria bacterium]